jgi:hypothetical protein
MGLAEYQCGARAREVITLNLERDGCEIVPSLLDKHEIANLRTELKSLAVSAGHRQLAERVLGVARLATSPKVRMTLASIGAQPVLVRSILFDKTPGANWAVPWHQDLTIAVRHRVDVSGYGPGPSRTECRTSSLPRISSGT